ncbi:hypothetical protein OIE66_23405 [Nonomuraea sp. NBC_01738]|uniref:hypothetical protein n=1 Tax=Nonomuraea sp. NBC_01738 TaxID=2976003 RepID=UPI002E11CC35|nr:hypothetical protein OIE66_23405 [Nonomuraea sp. NBC_01738]
MTDMPTPLKVARIMVWIVVGATGYLAGALTAWEEAGLAIAVAVLTIVLAHLALTLGRRAEQPGKRIAGRLVFALLLGLLMTAMGPGPYTMIASVSAMAGSIAAMGFALMPYSCQRYLEG